MIAGRGEWPRTPSSHGEPLLVQQLAVLAPDFQPPATLVHGQPAIRAIAFGRVCPNFQHHGLPQRVSAVPAMHDCGIARGLDTSEEDDWSRRRGLARRIAPPAKAARREGSAQLRGGHRDGARRRRLTSSDVSIIVPRRGRRCSHLFDRGRSADHGFRRGRLRLRRGCRRLTVRPRPPHEQHGRQEHDSADCHPSERRGYSNWRWSSRLRLSSNRRGRNRIGWRWRDDGVWVDRQTTRAAEVFKVLPAGHDHRMVGRQRCRRDGRSSAIERLGLARASRSFGDDGEVVQGVGEIRMKRAEFFFLNARGASQQLIGRRKVASCRGAFRPLEQLTSFLLFSHRRLFLECHCDCSPASRRRSASRSRLPVGSVTIAAHTLHTLL